MWGRRGKEQDGRRRDLEHKQAQEMEDGLHHARIPEIGVNKQRLSF